ncbi:single-strand binding protein family-domain-containing protein [Mycena rebaudengoi]|nr:single-strand binding protein family-domain-containing protein [Mycena rebaudengoi]
MFNLIRAAPAARATFRAFSTSTRKADLAKLTLIGNLGKEPELKITRNEKEYVAYSVATRNFLPSDNGERTSTTTWHRILSFLPGSNKYLQTLKPGSKVYVEAAYEIREPDAGADPSTPQGQRQIFLRHESLRVISSPRPKEGDGEEHTGEEQSR